MSNLSLKGREKQSVNTNPTDKRYFTSDRIFQGIPGIERTPGGRLWATWYSGGHTEMEENYSLLVTSNDDGKTWTEPVAVVDPPDTVRSFDPCLWHDPQGRLWWFWSQSHSDGFITDGNSTVWGVCTEDSESEHPTWSEPVMIGNGVMMNKPTVLSSGEWLMPTAVWEGMRNKPAEVEAQNGANVTVSYDNGKTFSYLGGALLRKSDRIFDEHMVVELTDGKLWMLIRSNCGVGQVFSEDKGKTWSDPLPSKIDGPNSRFFIRRLKSGKLLLINHDMNAQFLELEDYLKRRTHLTAWLSDNDGKTWYGGLLLDERDNISYPDGVEAEDGSIYIIYDRERYKDMEILMAVFTEKDIEAGKCVSSQARLKQIVNKAGPKPK
jgi:hypothetical protein